MEKINLNEVKVGNVIRYQFYMNCRNNYVTVSKITNKYIVAYDDIIRKEIKFKKETGRGVGYFNGYYIVGINDQSQRYKEDMENFYYY